MESPWLLKFWKTQWNILEHLQLLVVFQLQVACTIKALLAAVAFIPLLTWICVMQVNLHPKRWSVLMKSKVFLQRQPHSSSCREQCGIDILVMLQCIISKMKIWELEENKGEQPALCCCQGRVLVGCVVVILYRLEVARTPRTKELQWNIEDKGSVLSKILMHWVIPVVAKHLPNLNSGCF